MMYIYYIISWNTNALYLFFVVYGCAYDLDCPQLEDSSPQPIKMTKGRHCHLSLQRGLLRAVSSQPLFSSVSFVGQKNALFHYFLLHTTLIVHFNFVQIVYLKIFRWCITSIDSFLCLYLDFCLIKFLLRNIEASNRCFYFEVSEAI